MKKKSIPPFFSMLGLTCLSLIISLQLPALSLAFDFKSSDLPKTSVLSLISTPVFHDDLAPQAVFSNPAPITIADRNNNTPTGPVGISTPYPSTIVVSGLSGTVSDINVTINGLNTARPRDIDILLVGPGGQALTLMADTGDLNSTSPGVNITFDDSAASLLPELTAITSGTYKPTDYFFSATDRDDFPAPAPSTVNDPAPTGSATLASVFNGINPNGTWSLYIIDDSQGGGNSSITGGWSIDITTAGGIAATSTSIVSNLNPSLTTQTVTFTSTTVVSSDNSPVTTGTVSFTQNGNPIAGCTNLALNANGNAVCSTMLAQGTRTITATYSGTASLGTSNASLTQVVNAPTVVTGGQFCNQGGIIIPDAGSATPYPSNISVSGLVGTISKVTVQLNGLSAPRPSNLDFLLVGPGGQAFQFMSDVGDATTPVAGINLTLDDAAASQLPVGSALTGGTFRPTDADPIGSDPYPSPAPASFNRAAPTGSATFASVYNGTNPNGNWALYAVDDGVGGGSNSMTSWCLNFTVNKLNTTTTLTSSPNPSPQDVNIIFTATVTTSGSETPTGSVEFFDGATSLGTRLLNDSGQAILITSLAPGTHNIRAEYAGADVGAAGGGYSASTSNVVPQIVTVVTSAGATVSGRVISAQGRGIAGALVTMTDANGNQRYAFTNPFGFYRFTDVQVGSGYTVSAEAKNRRFAPRFVSVGEDIADLDFIEIIEP